MSLLLWASAVAGAAPSAPPSAASEPLVVGFDRLGVTDARVLRGIEGVETIPFTRPRTWYVEGDPTARIHFAHAPGYAGEDSRLSVRLNGREVAAVVLDPTNEARGVLDVPLPATLLADYNTLTLTATQRADDCTGAFDTRRWTRIDAASSIVFPGRPAPVATGAWSIRAPLFDPLGYGPLRLTPVLPEALSGGSLAALTELGLALGRVADWRRVQVEEPVARVEEARTAALLLGTASELPELRELVDVSLLTGDQGLVALVANPEDPTLPVLIVTGRTATGVLNAARAVARADRAAWLTGEVAVVEDVPDAPPPASERLPRPMGERETVRLADLGVRDHTGDGLYAASLSVPLLLEGDAVARPDGTTVRVRYAYGTGLDPELSTLEVRLDDVGLASVPLDRAEGDTDGLVSVKVPARLVGPHDTLQLGFHLFPAGFDGCVVTTDGHLWATVYADTEVRIERDHAAWLPDLALLRHRWFPFAAEGEGEQVNILLGERAERHDVAAALQVVTDLAARSLADDPPVAIVAGRPDAPGARVLLVREDQPHPARARLGLRQGGPRREGMATIEALQPDDRPGTGVLVVTAPDGRGLLALARQLGDDEVLTQLAGSRVVVGADGAVSVVESAATRRVVRSRGIARLRLLLQERSPASLLLVFPAALTAGFALRSWARRRGGVTE